MKVKQIALYGILVALVFSATAFIHIPFPISQGYVHAGDIIVTIASSVNPFTGAVAGAFGTSFADLYGFPTYAVPSFIVHGLQGLILGLLILLKIPKTLKLIAGSLISGLIIAFGYYFAEVILYNSFKSPIINLLPNFLQGFLGALIGLLIVFAIGSRIKGAHNNEEEKN